MNDEGNKILVVISESEHESRGVQDLVTRAIDVEKLHAQLTTFIDKLQKIVTFEEKSGSNFRLEGIEFSAEISAEGEFKLMGVGGSASATSTIKFVMKRKEQKD
jgi:hypothetical protein